MAIQGKKLTKEMEDKVISEKLLNPEASLRDIARNNDLSHVGVKDIIDEAPELLTSINTWGRTSTVLETLDSIIDNGNKIIDRFIRMAEWQEDEMIPIKSYNDLTAISWIQERSWKQRQIIEWKVTDRVDIWDYSTKTQKELEMIRQQELL